MLDPSEVISYFIVRILAKIVRLMILHCSGVDIHGIVCSFDKLQKLIENCIIVNVCTKVVYWYSKISNALDVIMEKHRIEAEAAVNTCSAVERALERMYVSRYVTPALIILGERRLVAVCKLTLRHIGRIQSADGKSEKQLKFGTHGIACVCWSYSNAALALGTCFIKTLIVGIVYAEFVKYAEIGVGFAHNNNNIWFDAAVEVIGFINISVNDF